MIDQVSPQNQVTFLGAYPYQNKSSAILDSSFNQNGTYLAVCNTKGEVYIYLTTNPENKSSFRCFKNHKAAALKVCWAHPKHGFLLASCSLDFTINLYSSQEKFNTIDMRYIIPTCIMFMPFDGIVLAAGTSSGALYLFDERGNVLEKLPQAHESALSCLECNYQFDKFNVEAFKRNFLGVDFCQQKLMLATGSTDKTVGIWEVTNSNMQFNISKTGVLVSHLREIRSLSWRPSIFQNFYQLTTASEDGVIKAWNIYLDKSQSKEIYSQKVGKTVWSVAWDPFGSLICISLLTEDCKNETSVYQMVSGVLLKKIPIEQSKE